MTNGKERRHKENRKRRATERRGEERSKEKRRGEADAEDEGIAFTPCMVA